MTTSHAAAVDAYAGELQLDMVVGSSNVAAVRAAGGRGCSSTAFVVGACAVAQIVEQ